MQSVVTSNASGLLFMRKVSAALLLKAIGYGQVAALPKIDYLNSVATGQNSLRFRMNFDGVYIMT